MGGLVMSKRKSNIRYAKYPPHCPCLSEAEKELEKSMKRAGVKYRKLKRSINTEH